MSRSWSVRAGISGVTGLRTATAPVCKVRVSHSLATAAGSALPSILDGSRNGAAARRRGAPGAPSGAKPGAPGTLHRNGLWREITPNLRASGDAGCATGAASALAFRRRSRTSSPRQILRQAKSSGTRVRRGANKILLALPTEGLMASPQPSSRPTEAQTPSRPEGAERWTPRETSSGPAASSSPLCSVALTAEAGVTVARNPRRVTRAGGCFRGRTGSVCWRSSNTPLAAR